MEGPKPRIDVALMLPEEERVLTLGERELRKALSSSGAILRAPGEEAVTMVGSEQCGDYAGAGAARLPHGVYEKDLFHHQAELVTLQEWVR